MFTSLQRIKLLASACGEGSGILTAFSPVLLSSSRGAQHCQFLNLLGFYCFLTQNSLYAKVAILGQQPALGPYNCMYHVPPTSRSDASLPHSIMPSPRHGPYLFHLSIPKRAQRRLTAWGREYVKRSTENELHHQCVEGLIAVHQAEGGKGHYRSRKQQVQRHAVFREVRCIWYSRSIKLKVVNCGK